MQHPFRYLHIMLSYPLITVVVFLLNFADSEDQYPSPSSLFDVNKPIIFDKKSADKVQTRQRRQGYVRPPQNNFAPQRGPLTPVPDFNPPSSVLSTSNVQFQQTAPSAPRVLPSNQFNSLNTAPPGKIPPNINAPNLLRPAPRFNTQAEQPQRNMRTRPLNWPAFKASNPHQSATASRGPLIPKVNAFNGAPLLSPQPPSPSGGTDDAHPYYFPPRMALPLPTCFHNPTGYACCNAQLNDLIVETYTELETKPKFHICNINAIANQIQKKAEERFNTTFETIAAFEDFAQKIHFHSDLVCKVELGGKFMLAYGTVKNVADKLEPEPSHIVKREVFGPEEEPMPAPKPTYHTILI
ncbi:unnamed protein product [Bursaphelenchus okinawaensis]|uniref:Ground-like domain-containing protein n=1 Tax=Bursaphelenchus okinawaensis TaxID=465554 RepID=A0A811LM48_9BILA|nr:unnamed protein product [Bursaphelenchus okinawaensis]CAG9126431.1 unnamed protein product [Bursaphelenchus okinawaensis]